jgi:hypothetical protein
MDSEVAYRAPCGCEANIRKIVIRACAEAVRMRENVRDNIWSRDGDYVTSATALSEHYKAAFIEENLVQTGD